MYPFLADVVLSVHVGFVIFVVGGVVFILIGGVLGWDWVRNRWLRLAHLLGVGIIVAQVWAGVICPLTTLEMWLRRQGGGTGYEGSFVQHWLQTLLYYQAPSWVFTAVYTGFGVLVVLSWLMVPPRLRRRSAREYSGAR